jgi:hypothetical protein
MGKWTELSAFPHSPISSFPHCPFLYTKPWSIIASATLRKPAMFAPFT